MKRYIAPVALVPLLLLPCSANAQTRELTLTCSGTATNVLGSSVPETVKDMGIVVNLTAKTVSGFIPVAAASVYQIDEVTINFHGYDKDPSTYPWNFVSGTMDRITGRLVATTIEQLSKDKHNNFTWELTCVPKKRLF